jgi:nucleotide-binding universal stress UspA family protein
VDPHRAGDDVGMTIRHEIEAPAAQPSPAQEIVVGVDGSPASRHALAWALGEGRVRGVSVRAVYAWRRPERPPRGYIPAELLDPARLQAFAESRLAQIAEGVVATSPEAPLVCEAVEGNAEDVLPRAGDAASLLVVGAPAHGAVGELVHGSVARACVRHARCPVVVVPLQVGTGSPRRRVHRARRLTA